MKKPAPFLWGTATSGHQVDGNNRSSDWWQWEQEGNIEGGACSGRATDHWKYFKEDLQRAADLGLNSYRFSVEWARVEPEEDQWSTDALIWYCALIDECERLNLLPMVTLHHFTLPQWLANRGGLSWPGAVERFSKYVDRVLEYLGGRVPLWCTVNEPMVLVAGAYIAKFMPPAVFSPDQAAQATRTLVLWHTHAYQQIHACTKPRTGPWKEHTLQVGFAHNLLHFKPDRYWHPIERFLSWRIHAYYNLAWLRIMTGQCDRFGFFGLVPKFDRISGIKKRRHTGFIGINYYTKAYLKWRPRDNAEGVSPKIPVGLSFARRQERISDVGWAIYPRGLGKIMRWVSQFGIPIYVTENGLADRLDQFRTEYIRDHLLEIARAIQDGIDIRGYYYWSLLDNFEWIKGFGPRFGLYSVNYSTLVRTPTRSAAALKDWIEKHRNGDLVSAPNSDNLTSN